MLTKLMQIFCLSCFVLLQSCQYDSEEKVKKDQATNKREDAVSYNIQLGMGYLKQGDMPRAKRKLLMATELAPNSPDATAAMAYYLEKTGDMSGAKKTYLKAIAMAPASGAQLNNYGTFLCRLEQYEEAESYFLKAVKDSNYVNTAAAYENAGLCASALPDFKKAKRYFIKALGQDPRRNQSLYELVSIELKQDNPEKALSYLQKYQELSLSDPTLASLAASVAHRAGKPDIEAMYKMRMSKLNQLAQLGENNEYDSGNG